MVSFHCSDVTKVFSWHECLFILKKVWIFSPWSISHCRETIFSARSIRSKIDWSWIDKSFIVPWDFTFTNLFNLRILICREIVDLSMERSCSISHWAQGFSAIVLRMKILQWELSALKSSSKWFRDVLFDTSGCIKPFQFFKWFLMNYVNHPPFLSQYILIVQFYNIIPFFSNLLWKCSKDCGIDKSTSKLSLRNSQPTAWD